MTEFRINPDVTCPTCEGSSFQHELKGRIFKKFILICNHCGLQMETNSKQTDFKVTEVGNSFSSAAPFLIGKNFTLSEIGDQGILSDETLTQIAAGEHQVLDELLEQEKESPVALKKGERIALTIPNITLMEERSKRVSTGTRGMSFRVAKGVRFYFGEISESQFESDLTPIDKGTFVVTDKRYIFVGGKRSIDQSLGKVTSIDPFVDAIAIARSNKQRIEYYTGGKSFAWLTISATILGMISRYNQ